MHKCAYEWCPHFITRRPTSHGHVLCTRHYDILYRSAEQVFGDWCGEATYKGLTPVSEDVWTDLVARSRLKRLDGQGSDAVERREGRGVKGVVALLPMRVLGKVCFKRWWFYRSVDEGGGEGRTRGYDGYAAEWS